MNTATNQMMILRSFKHLFSMEAVMCSTYWVLAIATEPNSTIYKFILTYATVLFSNSQPR